MINLYAMAAVAAVCNMGLESNLTKETVKSAQSSKSLDHAIVTVIGSLIESNDIYDAFIEEANGWLNEFSDTPDITQHFFWKEYNNWLV